MEEGGSWLNQIEVGGRVTCINCGAKASIYTGARGYTAGEQELISTAEIKNLSREYQAIKDLAGWRMDFRTEDAIENLREANKEARSSEFYIKSNISILRSNYNRLLKNIQDNAGYFSDRELQTLDLLKAGLRTIKKLKL